MEISRGIIFICNKRGISQKELSELTGLSQPMHCLIEKGKKKPSLDSLEKIAKALGVHLSVLIWLSSTLSEFPQEHGKNKKIIDKLMFEMYNLK
jgi:transcriptional regulator with XRE-family HTH domain